MLEVVLRKIDLEDRTCRNVSYPLMIIKPYMTPFIVHLSVLLDINVKTMSISSISITEIIPSLEIFA